MSIQINKDLCIGCGRCMESCPGNLIHKDSRGLAEIPRVQDCWGCTSCIKVSSVQAIRYFLGADVGGAGATLRAESTSHYLNWTVTLPDGTEETISIDRSESNQY